jgi:two-component system sensor histidine kinase PhoQ
MVVVASVVLAAFLGITALALERAFDDTGRELVRERLLAHFYSLLAAAEPGAEGRRLVLADLAEPRFSLPESGLYAEVRDATGATLWRSGSLLGRDLELEPPAAPGEPHFAEGKAPWGEALFTLSYRVRWELGSAAEQVMDLHLAESRNDFDDRVARFRRDIWLWLAALAVGLLLTQAAVLGWGLAPLERLSREVRTIELGERERLSEDQPRELRGLVTNLNQLIGVGRRSIERHRNALADLAHALKTPLAVIRGVAEDDLGDDPRVKRTVLDAVKRMDEALSYWLRRAAVAGEHTLGAPAALEPVVARLTESLAKVYADKTLAIAADVPSGLRAWIDEGDLTEILGNLLDNACKWARTHVRVEVQGGPSGRGLVLQVEDDGPGIAPEHRRRVLERGVRADERVPGQGLGLSLARELVEHYGGELRIGDAPGGGARVAAHLDVRTG